MWCLCRPFRWLSSLLYAGGTKDLCRTYRKVKKLQNTPALFHAVNILRQHVWVHGSLCLCTAGSYRGGGYATARRCHLWQRLHVQALVFPYSVAYNVSVSEFNPYYMKIKTSPTHVKQRRAVSLCDSWISCPTNILSRVHTEHCAPNFWGYETWGNLGTSENSEGHRSDWIDAEILHQKKPTRRWLSESCRCERELCRDCPAHETSPPACSYSQISSTGLHMVIALTLQHSDVDLS